MLYMSVTSLTAFIVAFAVIMSTMVMAAFERTREIGTLRAIGADARTILATVFVEIVMLADEPTGNLDSVTGEEIIGLLEQLHRAGQTIILVTHNAAVAARADLVLHLKDGALAA